MGGSVLKLPQNNDESLFLSNQKNDQYQLFKKTFNESPSIIVSFIAGNNNLVKEKIVELKSKFKSVRVQANEQNFLFKFNSDHYRTFILDFGLETSHFKELINYLLKLKSNELDVKIIGYPYNNFLLDQSSENISTKSFPILFLTCFVMLLFFIRQLTNALLIFIPALNSAFVSLFLIKLFTGHLNAINSIIPLLNFVIFLTLVLHLYFSQFALKRKFIPTFLTVITTAIGFGSLIVSDIVVIRDFAIVSFLSIMLNFLLTYLIIYYLRPFFIKKDVPFFFLLKMVRKFEFPPRTTLWVSFILVVGSLLAYPQLKINTNLVDFFSDKVDLKSNFDFFQKNIMGLPILEIVVDKTSEESDFDLIQSMGEVEKNLGNSISDIKIISLSEMSKEANFFYLKNRELPTNAYALMGLLSKVPEELKTGYTSENYYRITILGQQFNFKEYNDFLNKVRLNLKNQKIEKYSFNGFFYSVVTSHYSILIFLIYSFFSSCLVIFIIIGLYFRNIKLLSIFGLINLIPISSFFLFLFITGFSINMATVKVFSIALGMMVDNAIHICYEKKLEDELINPILFSGIILMVSFVILGFNDFLPIREFAFSMVYLIFIGLIYSLLILPPLLKKFKS